MKPKVIAIVGATATGKTALAIALANRLGGEVINADSRQFYRGMDIGTAKPTQAERAAVPHHLIDIAAPDDTVTLGSFADLARAAIEEIESRGNVPILVGGTGQYIWSLLEGWRIPRVPPDRQLRARLEAITEADGPGALAAELRRVDPVSAERIEARNVRRVIRAIEVTLATGRPFSSWQQKEEPTFRARVIGLRCERGLLYERIDVRVDGMVAAGLREEVETLMNQGYGCDLPSMSAIGYRQVCEYLCGSTDWDSAVAHIKTETHRLVRMQHAWFKADDPRIAWVDASSPVLLDEAVRAVSS